ncbi:peptidoglycan DD-metalloendopeptidase family protein [Patescibacteria group bacterium]|nr:peptidoglycan DD-metalloendopeptidase family protein [Patescibacteria group bacterium]
MKKQTKIKFGIILISLLFCFILPNINIVRGQEVDELNKEIDAKKKDVDAIKQKIATYQKSIQQKQNEAASLSNQLSILENQIAKAELDIKATSIEIEQTQLETRNMEIKIVEKEDKIEKKKDDLSDLLQELHRADQENTLRIFLLNNSFSDYFNQLEYTKDIQNGVQGALNIVKDEKQVLVDEKKALETKQEKLASLKEELDIKRSELDGEVDYKSTLIDETKKSEAKYNELYLKAKQEQSAISAEISNLEKVMRAKLESMKSSQPQLTDSTLAWPVPNRGITAFFHDPDYPFRYLFEHPAIDVRCAQGSSIKAPADGYVLKAMDNGMGYSYIALIHANGISTVYGHVSRIYVSEDEFVKRGDVIGLSGGMPGTPGAGRLCTGPHLHFEVRLNGIPVNPVNYLP